MVRQNVNKRVAGMIAYYRDGLAFGEWIKPERIQLLSAASATDGASTGLMEQKRGAFTCPVTIVYGGKDAAFHRHFCFEGLDDYLYPSKNGKGKSYLLGFPKSGHWPMASSPGRESLDMVIESELNGDDSEKMKERIWQVDKNIKVDVEK